VSIITLTTDYGLKDPSVSIIKGMIYSQNNSCVVVDITHKISPFNKYEASYTIKNSYTAFPRGSVHIIDVDAKQNPEQNLITVFLDDHYFISANNGIIPLISSVIKPTKIIEMDFQESKKETFVKAATHLQRGGNINLLGNQINELFELNELQINLVGNNEIQGKVIYIDNYGNVVTNIDKQIFDEFGDGRKYTIHARRIKFDKIYKSYSDAINFDIKKDLREEEGKKIAIFNKFKKLELGIYKSNPKTYGSAHTLFGLNYSDTVTVIFE